MEPKTSTQDDGLQNLDTEEAALRNEAMQIDPVRPEDAAIKDDTTEEQAASNSAEDTAKQTPDAKKAADKPSADDAKKETDQKVTTDKVATEDDAKLTPYEKERRRLNKSWNELKAEKEATRKEADELAAQRKQFEEERTKAKAAPKPTEKPKHNGYSAEDYEAAAQDLRAEGKTEEAALAEKRAKDLRAKEAELAKEAGPTTADTEYVTLATGARITPQEQQKMTAEWTANLKKLGEANPDLTKDGAPLRMAVSELLKPGAYPLLHSHASGIHYAVEVAKLKLAANEVPSLKTRIAELEAKNKELAALTSLEPSAGGNTRRERPKTDDMPLDQAETALREEAMAMDSRGG